LVVSVAEKAHVMCQVWTKKVSDERTSGSVERLNDDVETGGSPLSQDKSSGRPVFWLDGIRRIAGTSLVWALSWNVGTQHGMARENP
jgi:hypothetical protein